MPAKLHLRPNSAGTCASHLKNYIHLPVPSRFVQLCRDATECSLHKKIDCKTDASPRKDRAAGPFRARDGGTGRRRTPGHYERGAHDCYM